MTWWLIHVPLLPVSKEIFKLASTPAQFGHNVTLMCFVQHPLLNSKECPVRQWTIGANTAVLLYNDFSYNTMKYVDSTDLNSDHFSITIMNFSFSDVNRKYTCSCGFSSSSLYLALEESMFVQVDETDVVDGYNYVAFPQYSLPGKNNFGIDQLTSICDLAIPISSVASGTGYQFRKYHGQDATISFSSLVEKNGLAYDVSMTYVNKLTWLDCNSLLHPTIECQFHPNYSSQFSGVVNYTCEDLVDENDIETNEPLKASSSSTQSPVTKDDGTNYLSFIIAGGTFIFLLLVVVVILYRKRKKKCLACGQMDRQKSNENVLTIRTVNDEHPAQNPTSSSPLVCRGLD